MNYKFTSYIWCDTSSSLLISGKTIPFFITLIFGRYSSALNLNSPFFFKSVSKIIKDHGLICPNI